MAAAWDGDVAGKKISVRQIVNIVECRDHHVVSFIYRNCLIWTCCGGCTCRECTTFDHRHNVVQCRNHHAVFFLLKKLLESYALWWLYMSWMHNIWSPPSVEMNILNNPERWAISNRLLHVDSSRAFCTQCTNGHRFMKPSWTQGFHFAQPCNVVRLNTCTSLGRQLLIFNFIGKNDQHGYTDCCAHNLDLMTFREEHMVSFLLFAFWYDFSSRADLRRWPPMLNQLQVSNIGAPRLDCQLLKSMHWRHRTWRRSTI